MEMTGGALMHELSHAMRYCIANCTECHNVCRETLTHCFETGGAHAEPSHVRLLIDCAEICSISAAFMLRGSPTHKRICGICADICEQCAKDCERFTDDAHMTHCASICHSCASSCREMAMS